VSKIIKDYLSVEIILNNKIIRSKDDLFILSFIDNYIINEIDTNKITFSPFPVDHYNNFLTLLENTELKNNFNELVKYWFLHFQTMSFDPDLLSQQYYIDYNKDK
jgi:hypothetical protein